MADSCGWCGNVDSGPCTDSPDGKHDPAPNGRCSCGAPLVDDGRGPFYCSAVDSIGPFAPGNHSHA